MTIVLLSPDLMLLSAAQRAAERHGCDIVAVEATDDAVHSCQAPHARLLMIDLRHVRDISALVTAVRGASGDRVWIMACSPHVHEASLAAATAAGCDEVVTRGQFDHRFDAAVGCVAK